MNVSVTRTIINTGRLLFFHFAIYYRFCNNLSMYYSFPVLIITCSLAERENCSGLAHTATSANSRGARVCAGTCSGPLCSIKVCFETVFRTSIFRTWVLCQLGFIGYVLENKFFGNGFLELQVPIA